MSNGPTGAYRFELVARGYDALNALLWFPIGSDRLRRELVHALDVPRGSRVLELGCGTGLVTQHLCAAGAAVVAVDRAEMMLRAAARRAPAASFVVSDLLADPDPIDGRFDAIVLAFVLHELDEDRRASVLRRASSHLAPGGRIGILEWSLPTSPRAAYVWRRVVAIIEPPVALEVLDGGVERALAAAGLDAVDERRYASGRARVVIARASAE